MPEVNFEYQEVNQDEFEFVCGYSPNNTVCLEKAVYNWSSSLEN